MSSEILRGTSFTGTVQVNDQYVATIEQQSGDLVLNGHNYGPANVSGTLLPGGPGGSYQGTIQIFARGGNATVDVLGVLIPGSTYEATTHPGSGGYGTLSMTFLAEPGAQADTIIFDPQ